MLTALSAAGKAGYSLSPGPRPNESNTLMAPIVIRFGGYQKPASIHNQAAAHFGALLERHFGERIRFELIGDVLALGRMSGDLPLMVASGELSLCYISAVRYTKVAPECQLLELPFVVRDRATAYRALDGAYGDIVRRRIRANTPARLLGFWDNGFRHLSNRVRPIRTPADCAGLRIRTQMSELHVEVFRRLGFDPIPADVKEFVEQIGGERFQAQDNPLTNIYNFGVHEHHHHITLTGHFFGATVMVCNEAQFQSWPQDLQSFVLEAAEEATALQRRLAAAEDAAVLARLDPARNEVVHPDAGEHAAFVAAVQPVLAKYRGTLAPELFAHLE
jgi:TRAP-type C4-dicarboxylate transport system substrate-binding protein